MSRGDGNHQRTEGDVPSNAIGLKQTRKKCKKPLDNQKQICYNKYINQKGIDTNDY